jgi:hypothetical protein
MGKGATNWVKTGSGRGSACAPVTTKMLPTISETTPGRIDIHTSYGFSPVVALSKNKAKSFEVTKSF